MKRLIYSIALMAMAAPFVANAQEFDDIYYNPKKDKTVNQTTTKKQSNYIKDFSSIDVDQYNRRGQYYASPIDTIGAKAENDEDFVYTQQIQKYYNPTIVLDNADVLADVLNNSYGNVEIVFNNGIPSFSPYYYSYGWPYYNSYYGWNSWTWGPSWSWSWNWGPSWAWGPSWSWSWNWNWGPSWAWGPSWSWGWGWNNPWNWGHGPAWGPGRPYADYRPGGRLPNRPGSNWASNTRPGGNYNGGHSAAGGGYRPTNSGVNNRPNNSVFGGSATNHHRTYGTANGNTGTHSTNAGNSQNNGSNRNSYTVNSNGHRTYNNSSTLNNNSNNSNNNHRQTNNSYNNNSNRNNNYNYNSNSNRGGSFGSGSSHRSSGGFGGGGRSSGGGGARGTHR